MLLPLDSRYPDRHALTTMPTPVSAEERLRRMRTTTLALVLIVIGGAALFSAINGAPVVLDFFFVEVSVPLGAALLVSLLVGWIFGGLVAWSGGRTVRRASRRPTRVPSDTMAPDRQ